MELNSNQIAEILPHRYPFALVDRIVDGEAGKWAKGIKVRQRQRALLPGPLPPVSRHARRPHSGGPGPGGRGGPAVSAGEPGQDRLLRRHQERPVPPPVTPGDVLELECTLTKQKGPVGIGEAKATVNGQVAATAELTFALGKDS